MQIGRVESGEPPDWNVTIYFQRGRYNDELTRIRFNYAAESGRGLNRYSIDWQKAVEKRGKNDDK